MDNISKLPPPTSPEARHICPEHEFASRSARFTVEQLEYNCAVTAARTARGAPKASAPKTPRLNGWKTQFDLLS